MYLSNRVPPENIRQAQGDELLYFVPLLQVSVNPHNSSTGSHSGNKCIGSSTLTRQLETYFIRCGAFIYFSTLSALELPGEENVFCLFAPRSRRDECFPAILLTFNISTPMLRMSSNMDYCPDGAKFTVTDDKSLSCYSDLQQNEIKDLPLHHVLLSFL